MSNLFRKNHPMFKVVKSSLWDLPTPSKLSSWWKFGSLMGLCLMLQMVTGIFLAMHYTGDTFSAFSSMSHMMRDVNNGWVLRKSHAKGASLFFLCIYFHIGRGLYYGSYQNRETWSMGVVLFLLSILTAFFGYVLPWGQMSFWAAGVITNLVAAVPYVGGDMVQWMWGGFAVENPTLQRFFVFHFLLPFVLAFFSLLHLLFLHGTGSKNPLGMNSGVDVTSFHSFFSSKDLFGFVIFFLLLGILTFLFPLMLSDPENFMPAKPLVTPVHMQPEWYFLFAYAMLRTMPKKLGGVLALVSAILVLFVVPMLHVSPQAGCSFRPASQVMFWTMVGNFVMLTWMGSQPVESPYIFMGQAASLYYFFAFLCVGPFVAFVEKEISNCHKSFVEVSDL